MSTFYDPYDILKLVSVSELGEENKLHTTNNMEELSEYSKPDLSSEDLRESNDLVTLTFCHLGDPMDSLYYDFWDGYFHK